MGCRWFGWNAVFAFGSPTRDAPARRLDRRLVGKPKSANGLGFGSGPVSVVLAILIACAVAYLAVTRQDVQERTDAGG